MNALVASPAASGSRLLDPVRALQHALYRAAKADSGRRFHALQDKVHRRDVLWRAWVAVRRNDGAPGTDKTTLSEVEEYGGSPQLDELAADLKDDGWRPLPARRVFPPLTPCVRPHRHVCAQRCRVESSAMGKNVRPPNGVFPLFPR